jgi:hypothetical protein
LLTQKHITKDNLPIDANTIQTWREGHPNFSPFQMNQKVIKKINITNRSLKYKLGQKYQGPFIITKINSNRVSYELVKDEQSNPSVIKAHHKQLRPWKEIPKYISKYIIEEEEEENDSNSINSGDTEQGFVENNCSNYIYSDSITTESSDEDANNNTKDQDIYEINTNMIHIPKDKISRKSHKAKKNMIKIKRYGEELLIKQSTPKGNLEKSEVLKYDFEKYLKEHAVCTELFEFLEQTLNAQEEMLDNALFLCSGDVNNTVNPNLLASNVDLNTSAQTDDNINKSPSHIVSIRNKNEKLPEEKIVEDNFSGFSTNELNTSKQKKCLTDLKNLVIHARQTLAEKRRRSADFRRELLVYRENRSIYSNTQSTKMSEIDDIATEYCLLYDPVC